MRKRKAGSTPSFGGFRLKAEFESGGLVLIRRLSGAAAVSKAVTTAAVGGCDSQAMPATVRFP
jgi:hypothetical protein